MQLGAILKIEHGWPFKSEHTHAPELGEPRLIRIGNFARARGDVFHPEAPEGYSGEFPSKYILKPGALLLAMTCQSPDGAILGWPMQVPDNGINYLHNQRVGKVTVIQEKLANSRFLKYLFQTEAFNKYLVASASGSKILHTSPGRIEEFEFELPPVDEQRRIAGVLGALDDLIDTNEGLIKTMQARLTAQFHKVSSPGAGTDVLANFVKSAARGVSPKYSESHDDFYVLNQKCIRDGLVRLQQARHMTARSVKAEKIAEPGDVVVNSTGVGTLGRAARWMGTEPIFVDSHVTVVKPSDPEEAAWIARSIIESIDEIEALAQGSTGQTELSKDQLLSLKIPVPRRNVRIQIAKEFDTIDSTIEALSAESIQLRRTRDELLPLLMSGKIRVREAEEVVASVTKGDG